MYAAVELKYVIVPHSYAINNLTPTKSKLSQVGSPVGKSCTVIANFVDNLLACVQHDE